MIVSGVRRESSKSASWRLIALWHISPSFTPAGSSVCTITRRALPAYENEDRVQVIRRFWDSYASTQQKDINYDWLYPDDLIEQLVDVAIQNVEQFVPNAQRYSKSLQDFSRGDEFSSETSLEDILNGRLVLLLSDPVRYGNWEKKVFSILRKLEIRDKN